jgi:shikimate dehydrogenase
MAISGATRLLFVIGDPIGHASAPGLINAKLASAGINAVMVPLHVSNAGLAETIAALRAIHNCEGAIITMPHKRRVIEHLDVVTETAGQVGAVNVVRREPDGRLAGTLLDGEGFVAGLERAGHRIAGARVLLLGAGGAAAAIAFAVARHGATHLTVHNRSAMGATDLIARLRDAGEPISACSGAAVATNHDVIVNATPLGMNANDPLPLDPNSLQPGMLAAEVIITPERTAFLAHAAQRGCAVHPGRPMLVAQLDLMLEFMGVHTDGQ